MSNSLENVVILVRGVNVKYEELSDDPKPEFSDNGQSIFQIYWNKPYTITEADQSKIEAGTKEYNVWMHTPDDIGLLVQFPYAEAIQLHEPGNRTHGIGPYYPWDGSPGWPTGTILTPAKILNGFDKNWKQRNYILFKKINSKTVTISSNNDPQNVVQLQHPGMYAMSFDNNDNVNGIIYEENEISEFSLKAENKIMRGVVLI